MALAPAKPVRAQHTSRVVAAALVLVVVGSIGAVAAGMAGAAFTFDLEQTQPALARTPPTLMDPHTPRLARRVIVAVIDGLRYDRSFGLPFLDELRRRGVDGEATSHYPTYSRPNYVSILTGVPPVASGVRTNHHSTPVALDSLMDRARAAGLRVVSATDYDVLPRLFLRARTAEPTPPILPPSALPDVPDDELDGDDAIDIDALDHPEVGAGVHAPDANLASPFDDARYAPWPGGFTEAGTQVTAGSADLVILLVGAVDAAGHAHGGDSPEYRQAAEIADHALARTLAHVDLEQDAVIVVADHGHTGRGGHGGMEPEVLSVPLVMAGAGIVRGSMPVDARLIDIAPTVAALLGMPAPGHGLGRTLVETLALDATARAARQQADAARVGTASAVVAAAEAIAADDVTTQRVWRLALVGGGMLVAIGLAIWLVRRRVLRFDARVLAVSVPAFFVVYYGLIATFGQRFSPSLVPANGHLVTAMAKYGLVGTVVQLAASLWALRKQGNLAQRLAAANGIAWAGLLLTMVPAGLMWAFFPPPYITVPGPVRLVLIPAVEVAVACAAINVALTLAVEVIVFTARAWYRDHPA